MASARGRRSGLLAAMTGLGERGIHCGDCVGRCCTFRANSMQITPVEARDLRTYLKSRGRWHAELRAELEATMREYGLDRPRLGNGRASFTRRRYTCPFFNGTVRGCTIAPESKPYGCLGFNPRSPGITAGGDCGSDREALLAREAAHPDEASENEALADALGWQEPRLSIPEALLLLFASDD